MIANRSRIVEKRSRPPVSRRDALIFVHVMGVAILALQLGVVTPSHRVSMICLPVWIALGVAIAAWMVRGAYREMVEDGAAADAGTATTALLYVIPAAIATTFWAIALPSLAHRVVSTPFEVRSFVGDKEVSRGGRTTSYCLIVAGYPSHPAAQPWCTEEPKYERARIGQTVVLHGSTSWFGMLEDHFDLVDDDPKRADR